MEQPTKEQILEAAKTSPEAKEALTKLFPNVFENEKPIDLRKLTIDGRCRIFTQEQAQAAGVRHNLICVRSFEHSDLRYISFFLCEEYNWELKRDNGGDLCLIPTRK